jgi:hypothetical protein
MIDEYTDHGGNTVEVNSRIGIATVWNRGGPGGIVLVVGDDRDALLNWLDGSDWAAAHGWRETDAGFGSFRFPSCEDGWITPLLLERALSTFVLSLSSPTTPRALLHRELPPAMPFRALPSP